jgi:hypothetical protein
LGGRLLLLTAAEQPANDGACNGTASGGLAGITGDDADQPTDGSTVHDGVTPAAGRQDGGDDHKGQGNESLEHDALL